MSSTPLIGLIEPAVQVDDRMTVGDLPGLLSCDAPVFMRMDEVWHAIVPRLLVAQPPSRRLLDVPRVRVEPIGKRATLTEFERIARRAVLDHSPVIDDGDLVGRLRHKRVYDSLAHAADDTLGLRSTTLAMLHDIANTLMIMQPAVLAHRAEEPAAVSAYEHCVEAFEHLRAIHRGTFYGRQAAHLGQLVPRLVPILEVAARPFARVEVSPPPNIQVDCAPLSVQRALINLVTNAAEAMGGVRGGKISIEFAVREHAVDIVVTDDGEGIALDALPHIFERGFSTKSRSGRGHGLANVRASARASGGDVIAVPRRGGGTVFTLSLPKIAV